MQPSGRATANRPPPGVTNHTTRTFVPQSSTAIAPCDGFFVSILNFHHPIIRMRPLAYCGVGILKLESIFGEKVFFKLLEIAPTSVGAPTWVGAVEDTLADFFNQVDDEVKVVY
jgi:hypothetical protein